ncbi:MAG: mucoidy inhibitor MuiA family protein [Chloroflexi bacterium]|nr:mucoidy inhibitor MuiA family protein [Chloroflexota bacterium]
MDISFESQVGDVTVYPDRARVVCAGKGDVVETGLHRLLVENLPLTLEPESVRVAGKGFARVRILSVDVARRYYEATPAQNAKALEDEIESLEDAYGVLMDDKGVWEAHGRFLNGMREATQEYARGLSRGRTTVAEQAEIVAFLQSQDRELHTAVRDLDQQMRQLERRIDKLKKELNAIQSARPKQRYQAQVEVDVLEAGEFELSVSYVVRKAGWQPLYDIRLVTDDAGKSHVEVSYIAQIVQNSGQNWDNVQLVVSTARPALNQRLPELKPWFVDVLQPIPRKPTSPAKMKVGAVRSAAMRVEADAMPAMAMAAPEMAAAEVVTATVQDSGTAVSFSIPGTTTIPSDGSPHKSTMMHFKLDPKLDYLAVPKHTDAVFRRATVENESGSPLLAGNANLFVGDEFIGKTRLAFTPANGEVELLLGVEDRVTVERELLKRDVDKRFLRDNRQLRYGFKIELKNLMKTAVSVELHDHIPVSRHEQIKIKLEKADPTPSEQSDLNLLEWQLKLQADETRLVQYEYSAEHPRSLQVTGLS